MYAIRSYYVIVGFILRGRTTGEIRRKSDPGGLIEKLSGQHAAAGQPVPLRRSETPGQGTDVGNDAGKIAGPSVS